MNQNLDITILYLTDGYYENIDLGNETRPKYRTKPGQK